VRICGNSNSAPANLIFEKMQPYQENSLFFARDALTLIFFTENTEDGRDEVIVRQEGCTQGSCCEGHKVIW
jgi:hypothetical protein